MDALAQLNSALAGRYDIDREVGRGGMATVYLARDVKHDRRVALKVLNPELGAVLGVERFLSEIKVTANLQHPNLLALFDSGQEGGLLFYVMPYVEGESLRARLEREKQLPVDEATRLTTAIAGALGYAHRHGVIHRDLKPENVLLHEGQPLVADFGIALAVSNAGGNRITQTGLSLGTPQYMSPEQATGDRNVDGRADIYSLGAILYEMLTGDPPHVAGTAQAVIAKVLTEKPRSMRTARPAVPPYVDAAVERALEKLPADRFGTALEFADAVSGKTVLAPTPGSRDGTGTVPAGATRFGLRDVAYTAALAAAIAVAGLQWTRAHRPDQQPVVRFPLVIPYDQHFRDGLNGTPLAISPTGDRIAYITSTSASANPTLWVRGTDQLEGKAIAAPLTIRYPCFSPDGKWVAFTDGFDVKKVSVEGGPIVTLATVGDYPYGLSWGPRGMLVAGRAFASGGLFAIGERGGAVRILSLWKDGSTNRWPVLLPDGNTIAFATFPASGSVGGGRLAVASLTSDRRTILDVHGTAPVAFLNGQLVYATETGTLMAVPFDTRRWVTTGTPIPLIQDVITDPLGGAKAAISASGTLVYRSGKSETQPVLAHGSSITPLIAEPRDFATPRFSPDGKRVAFTVGWASATDIWVFDRTKGTLTRVTSDGVNQRPDWSPDGKRLVFVSDRGGQAAFWSQPADGSGPAELLYRPAEGDPFEGLLSPDGHWLIYRTGPAARPPRSIFAVRLDGDRTPIVLVTNRFYTQMPRLSPDGRSLAYQSNESNSFEIYVRPFPGAGGRVQVSVGGGTEPVWARSGHTLYYRHGLDIVAATVTTGAAFAIGDRRVVLSGDYLPNSSHANYDVSPDDSQFLMIRRAGLEPQTIVVHNWVRELMSRVATQK